MIGLEPAHGAAGAAEKLRLSRPSVADHVRNPGRLVRATNQGAKDGPPQTGPPQNARGSCERARPSMRVLRISARSPDQRALLLAAMDLVRVEGGGRVVPRPAAARFAPEVVEAATASAEGQQSLL